MGRASSPINASAVEAARIGAGQRTTAVPTRRHRWVFIFRLGSKIFRNRLPIAMTAGPNVNAANTTTSMPIASGKPSDMKYGNRVKCRQNVAPAMVSPEPRITCEVP